MCDSLFIFNQFVVTLARPFMCEINLSTLKIVAFLFVVAAFVRCRCVFIVINQLARHACHVCNASFGSNFVCVLRAPCGCGNHGQNNRKTSMAVPSIQVPSSSSYLLVSVGQINNSTFFAKLCPLPTQFFCLACTWVGVLRIQFEIESSNNNQKAETVVFRSCLMPGELLTRQLLSIFRKISEIKS